MTEDPQPMEQLSEEQKANIRTFESKYKQKVMKQKGNMIPRSVPEIPMEVKTIQEILVKLGDYSSLGEDEDLSVNIFQLSEVLIEVGDLNKYPEEISDLFVKCFSQLSVQIPILSTLLMLISEKEREFVRLVIVKLQVRYLLAAGNDEILTMKLLLRCFACLASNGCFQVESSGGLFTILELLSAPLEKLLSNSAEGDLSEEILCSAYLVASTVPWCIEALLSSEHGKSLVQTIHAYLSQVKKLWENPFELNGRQAIITKKLPDHFETQLRDEEMEEKVVPLFLFSGVSDSLSEAIQVAIHFIELYSSFDVSKASINFPEVYFMPWKQLQEKNLFQNGLAASDKFHFTDDFPSLWTGSVGKSFRANLFEANDGNICYYVGEKLLAQKNANFVHARVSIFNSETNDDCYPCCQLSFVEKYLVISYLEDILNYFDVIINEDGTKTGSLELLANQLLAVSRLFSINNDSSSPTKLAIEYFIIEMLFQKILSLPINRRTNNLVAFKLILHFCKKFPSFPPMVALASNIIFLMIPFLNIYSVLQFSNWFSFHFVNTALQWPFWDFWIGEVGLLTEASAEEQEGNTNDKDHRLQLFFIRAAIQQCLRLVSREKLELTIPSEFKEFLGNNAESRLLIQDSPDAPVDQLKAMVERRVSAEKIIDFVESIPKFMNEENHQTLIEAIFQSISVIVTESQTLATLIGLLEYYDSLIRIIVDEDIHHMILSAAIFRLYEGNNGMLLIFLEELIRRGHLHATAVAHFLMQLENFPAMLVSNPLTLEILSLLQNLSFDFVRASLFHRQLFSGEMMDLQETANLAPCEEPESHQVNQTELDAEVMDDDDEMGERKRARGLSESANAVWAADESLKLSVKNARSLYRAVIEFSASVLTGTHVQAKGPDSDLLRNVSVALIHHCWRGYFGFQTQISYQFSRRIIIVDPASNDVMNTLQRTEPALVQAWSQFL